MQKESYLKGQNLIWTITQKHSFANYTFNTSLLAWKKKEYQFSLQ